MVCHHHCPLPDCMQTGEQNASVALYPLIFLNTGVPSYLFGIIAAVGVLVVVFLFIVGVVGCSYYKRNKVVIMKV